MSLLSDVIASAEEGQEKKENPIIAMLNINVKGEQKEIAVKKHSDPEKLAKAFVAKNHLNKKAIPVVTSKIAAIHEEGMRVLKEAEEIENKSCKNDEKENKPLEDGFVAPDKKPWVLTSESEGNSWNMTSEQDQYQKMIGNNDIISPPENDVVASLNVNLGGGRSEDILIRGGDDTEKIAKSFVAKHQLPKDTSVLLTKRLQNLKQKSLKNLNREGSESGEMSDNSTKELQEPEPAKKKPNGFFRKFSKAMGLGKNDKSEDNGKKAMDNDFVDKTDRTALGDNVNAGNSWQERTKLEGGIIMSTRDCAQGNSAGEIFFELTNGDCINLPIARNENASPLVEQLVKRNRFPASSFQPIVAAIKEMQKRSDVDDIYQEFSPQGDRQESFISASPSTPFASPMQSLSIPSAALPKLEPQRFSKFSPYKDNDRGTPGSGNIGSIGMSTGTYASVNSGENSLSIKSRPASNSPKNTFIADLSVKISAKRQEKLSIHHGDDPQQVAVDFVQKYRLPSSVVGVLAPRVQSVLDQSTQRDHLLSQNNTSDRTPSSNSHLSTASVKGEQRSPMASFQHSSERSPETASSTSLRETYSPPNRSTGKDRSSPDLQLRPNLSSSPKARKKRSDETFGPDESNAQTESSRILGNTSVTSPRLDPVSEQSIRRDCRDLFQRLDLNRDGRVTKIELIKGLHSGKNAALAQLLNLPEHIRQEDGTRDIFMRVFHMIDKDESKDITLEEFIDFCLEHHNLGTFKAHTPSSNPFHSSAERRGRTQALRGRSKSADTLSSTRSLSPSLQRSTNRLFGAAEVYRKRKEQLKEKLQQEEDLHVFQTREKWRNDLIRHRITGSSAHSPQRSRSAPRSSAAFCRDLYARDQKWLQVKRKSIDALKATIEEKKKREEENPTFQPKLVTSEFNKTNYISSLYSKQSYLNRPRSESAPSAAESSHEFKPKISLKSESLARKRRMLAERERVDLTSLSSKPPSPTPSTSSTSPPAAKPRSKSPSLFANLYKHADKSKEIQQKAAEKYRQEYPFRPEIGQAKYRKVESDRSDFVQRLYDYRMKQQGLRQALTKEVITSEMGPKRLKKKMSDLDWDRFLKRLERTRMAKDELVKDKKLDEERRLQQLVTTKHTTAVSKRLTSEARTKALEEIFDVLLMSAEMSRERKKAKEGSGSGSGVHQSWGVRRATGEEAYEIVPSPEEESQPTAEESHHVLDSISVENLDVRLLQESSEGDRDGDEDGSSDASRKSHSPLRRNLLHNFLSVDDSMSTESSVLHRWKHQAGVEEAKGQRAAAAANELPDFESSTVKDSSSHDKASGEPKSDEGPLLDTSLAIPEYLQPKALAEAVTMIMKASAPHHLSKLDFIECFEVLIASGLAAPMNALLTLTPTVKKAKTEDIEIIENCHPPKLHSGPKSSKLRAKARNDIKGEKYSNMMWEYNKIYSQRRENRRNQLEAEESKRNTFEPVMFTKNRKKKAKAVVGAK